MMLYGGWDVAGEYLCCIMEQGKRRRAIRIQTAPVQAVAYFAEEVGQQSDMEGMLGNILGGRAAHKAPAFDRAQAVHVGRKMKMIVHQ
ncbi:hypothetical protein J15TS10_07800 [Paenibacillus woosongensis]|uniref:Uncharacterized protein n=1 Tax=Paenibacillus woosongensis TaxID=307580 RepID=A0ABQ4MLX5_9BACL|nr:hypothetical protein J15TS10_07800 [Paenibacillus woosongensis]